MSPLEQPTAAQALADFAHRARWDGLPQAVRREAGRAWLNWVGCAVGGARTPAMEAAVQGVLAMETAPGTMGLIARSERVGLADAALLNSLGSSAHTFDDTHLATITHPTGPVAAAALATAQQLSARGTPVSGSALLTALMVGMEIECRMSCAIAAGQADGGWFMTGLSGGIGAAAGAGLLLGLSASQLAHALGLAAAQSSGMRATHGSMAITFVPGIAARNGLVAAYMASAGFTCSPIALDGRNGLLQVLTGGHDGALLSAGLGERYEVLNNTYKPYPCGIVIHPALDASLQLAAGAPWSIAQVERVELRVHPDALRLCWRKLPDNVLDAQVSLFHWVAVALARGAAGLREAELECVMDPSVRALQTRTEASADPALRDNQALVRLRLRDGRVFEHFTDNAIGSVTRPMTDDMLQHKFRQQGAPVIGAQRCEDLLALCLDTAHTPDVAALVPASQPTA